MSSRLSHAARRFLAEEVHSVMQLELLLLLHRDARRAWSAEEAARELRAPLPWIITQLVDLITLRVVECADPDGMAFRFVRAVDLASTVDEIAREYPRRRTSVIKAIFSPGRSDLEQFSDAFRLRDQGG